MVISTKSPETMPRMSDELLRHYKPLAIKAVLAGCAVKAAPRTIPLPVSEYPGPLPEGFHIPQSLDD